MMGEVKPSMERKHTEIVKYDNKKNELSLCCSCGWIRRLMNESGPLSKYSDSDAWANHFNMTGLIR